MHVETAPDETVRRQIQRNQIITAVLVIVALLNVGLLAVILGGLAGVQGVLLVVGLTVAWVVVAYLIYNYTVLNATGAREPRPDEARRLRPIVDELSSRLDVDAAVNLRVIDDDAPNAFAVGAGSRATVVFSTGLLALLDDEELEGVAAHELSHIANGDTRIALYSASLLGWALAISIVASVIALGVGLWGIGVLTHHDGDDDWAAVLAKIAVGLLMIAVAIGAFIAVQTWFLISKISHMAVFRQREWVADATAARATGKPERLADALEKAAQLDVTLERGDRLAQALCIFGAPGGNWWDDLFNTHPDIHERIARLRSYASSGNPSF